MAVPDTSRSYRLAQPVWEKANTRAEGENRTMSSIVAAFVTAYAEGEVDALDKVKVVYVEAPAGK